VQVNSDVEMLVALGHWGIWCFSDIRHLMVLILVLLS